MKLSNKNAIITGASQGLGAAIAESFLAEGAGVLICARNGSDLEAMRSQLAAQGHAAVHAMVCDVSDVASVDALVARAREVFPKIDCLVNNAGIYGPMGAIDEVDWKQWTDAIAINLYGTVYPSRAILPLMKAQGHGSIINISGGGATNPLPGISAYAASKAAVVRFTETLALEVRQNGITVNAIAPGALATRMMDQAIEAGADAIGRVFHARMISLKQKGGTPLDVGARCCVWLASDASAGVTGKLIAAQWDPYKEFPQHLAELDGTDIYTLRRIVPKDRGKDWGNDN